MISAALHAPRPVAAFPRVQPLYTTFFPKCAQNSQRYEVTSNIVADALRVYVAQSCDGDNDGNYNYSLAAAE